MALKSSIKALTERSDALEKSQDFISKCKGQTTKLDKKYKEVTDSLEQKHAELAGTTDKHEEALYQIECSVAG